MYKLCKDEKVIQTIDGRTSFILGSNTFEEKKYLEWLSLGNSPDPYVEPEVSYKEKRRSEYPSSEDVIGALMDSGLINFDQFPELKQFQEKRISIKQKYPKA